MPGRQQRANPKQARPALFVKVYLTGKFRQVGRAGYAGHGANDLSEGWGI